MNLTNHDGLDSEARATAQSLLDAFSHIRLDRPSPATTTTQDAHTSGLVAAAFDGVRLQREPERSPRAAPLDLHVVPLPRRRHRRWPALTAAAASVAAVSIALALGTASSSPAWASEPSTPSPQDITAITAACTAPLERGAGGALSSGVVSVNGAAAPSSAPALTAPDSLPPLAALDLRGDIAFAVYQDSNQTATCVANRDNTGWHDQDLQLGPGTANTQPGVIAAGGSATVAGEQITAVTGATPLGAARVTFQLDDGTEVRASLLHHTWAAWFPGNHHIEPGSIRAYNATGDPISIGAPR